MTFDRPPNLARRPAFTLIELLVVITLLIVFLGIALPVISAITGSRSTEAARNEVSAMLARARAEAVNEQQQIGMALFVDPANGRSTVAVVAVGAASLTGPASLQAWTFTDASAANAAAHITIPNAGVVVGAVTPVQYVTGDIVFRLYAFNGSQFPTAQTTETLLPPYNGVVKQTVKAFQCVQAHSPSANGLSTGNNPVDIGTCAPGTGSAWQQYWEYLPPTAADLLDGTYEALPANVGVEVINNQHVNSATVSVNTNQQIDKYLKTGIVVFDATGKLVTVPFSIAKDSQLGKRMRLTADLGSGTATPLESQVGFALYDQGAAAALPYYSSGDFSVSVPGLQGPASWADEQQEETWIDANADLFFVNRFTGAMQKAQ